jgi:hypothetical protein
MNEWLPVKATDTLDEVCDSMRRRAARLPHADAAGSGQARLAVEWDTHITFEHPATFTEAEAKEAFLQLAARLARSQCLMIIRTLPEEVVPVVFPQLQEVAEYEVRMWQVREELGRPDIHESWLSLPITA